MRDPYAVLGVAKTASASEIKSAFRKRAKLSHPDRNKDDPKAQERFSELSRAYEIIGDETKRKQFDRGEIDAEGRETFHGYPGGHPYAGAGFDGFESHTGPGGFQFRSTGRPDAAEDILSELFGSAFGGGRKSGGPFAGRGGFANAAGATGGARKASAPQKGADIEATLTVTVGDMLDGGKAKLKLPDGRTVAVNIPQGAVDGQVIRLKGQGQAGPAGHRGDVLARIRIKAVEGMRVDGSNIFLDVDVPLETAITGGKVSVSMPDGKKVALSVPAWTSSGQTLRLKGKGLPAAKGARGDLLAVLQIQLPDEKREELEALFKKTEV
jgi:DnaJ-class molecular chaperone